MLEHPAALAAPPINWRELGRVLLVRPDNLGDVVMVGPALRALRRAAPAARLDLLAAPAGAGVARLLPELDGVITASVSWQQAGPAGFPLSADRRLADQVAQGRYGAAVIMTSFSQTPWPAGYLCREAGVPIRVGMSKEFGGVGLTHWVPAPPDSMHQVDRALYLLDRVGVPPVTRRLRLTVPPGATVAGQRILAAHGGDPDRPYVLMMPGASCPARRYPSQRYAEVAALLAEQGRQIVVAGTARETALVETVARAADAVTLAGVLDIPALASVVARASVVICNNSGGAHLADALRTPLVLLFAGTEQLSQYRPLSTTASVLTVPTGCAPCHQFTCPYARNCLAVPPRQVATATARLAGGQGSERAGLDAGVSRWSSRRTRRSAAEQSVSQALGAGPVESRTISS